MSATENRPQNLNFLSQLGFKLEIPRAPNFNYFIQKVIFPGVSLPNATQPNPFVNTPIPGDHLEYESLRVIFKLDEDFRGYLEMYDWIFALGKPESFKESAAIYHKPKYEKDGVFSDISLIVLNANMMPNIEFKFFDVLPKYLSGFNMESDANDVNYITATLELSYRMYKYNYLN